MSMWRDLSVEQNNDRTFSLTLTVDSEPLNITSLTLSLVLKDSRTATDASGTTYTAGSGLTVVSALLGKVSWALPHAQTGTPGMKWWRIDVVDGAGNRTTVMLGNLIISAV